jgi:hypothetical protein
MFTSDLSSYWAEKNWWRDEGLKQIIPSETNKFSVFLVKKVDCQSRFLRLQKFTKYALRV